MGSSGWTDNARAVRAGVSTMSIELHIYKAKVVKVYDADTIKVDIDAGFGMWLHRETLRLRGINAYEVRGEERERGLEGRDYLRDLILDKEILVKTHKGKGKYGRWIADIYLIDNENLDYSINDALVDLGHAVYRNYG